MSIFWQLWLWRPVILEALKTLGPNLLRSDTQHIQVGFDHKMSCGSILTSVGPIWILLIYYINRALSKLNCYALYARMHFIWYILSNLFISRDPNGLNASKMSWFQFVLQYVRIGVTNWFKFVGGIPVQEIPITLSWSAIIQKPKTHRWLT